MYRRFRSTSPTKNNWNKQPGSDNYDIPNGIKLIKCHPRFVGAGFRQDMNASFYSKTNCNPQGESNRKKSSKRSNKITPKARQIGRIQVRAPAKSSESASASPSM